MIFPRPPFSESLSLLEFNRHMVVVVLVHALIVVYRLLRVKHRLAPRQNNLTVPDRCPLNIRSTTHEENHPPGHHPRLGLAGCATTPLSYQRYASTENLQACKTASACVKF